MSKSLDLKLITDTINCALKLPVPLQWSKSLINTCVDVYNVDKKRIKTESSQCNLCVVLLKINISTIMVNYYYYFTIIIQM